MVRALAPLRVRRSIEGRAVALFSYPVTAVVSALAAYGLYFVPLLPPGSFTENYGFYVVSLPIPAVGVALLFSCQARGYGIATLAGWIALMVFLVWTLVMFAQGD